MSQSTQLEDAPIGHNLPPADEADFDALKTRALSLLENADRWATERTILRSEPEAEKAGDFLDQLRRHFRKIDEARKVEKQPHIDAGKAVDEKYRPLKERIERSAKTVKELLTPWLERRERERQEELRRVQAEAERKRREAEEAARQADMLNDRPVSSEVEAEEKQADAAAAERKAARLEKARAKVGSGFGGRSKSLRTKTVVTVPDWSKVPVRAYRDLATVPYVQDALNRAVQARGAEWAKANIPSAVISEERTTV